MKINIKEPVTIVIIETGEKVEFKETGIQEIEEYNLRMERIITQSNGKIELIKEEKKSHKNKNKDKK